MERHLDPRHAPSAVTTAPAPTHVGAEFGQCA
jgi:hypothetical protein